MNPSLVQGFWHGDALSPLHWACLRSFLRSGLRFDLYSYQSLSVPPGVRLRDAAEVVERDKLFLFNNAFTGSPDVAPFADYFRLKLLYERGGWWCDVDTIAQSGSLPVGDCVWARQAPEYRSDSVSNGQLYFEAGHRTLKRLIREAERAMPRLATRETLGPELFTRVIGKLGLPRDMNATPDQFYPIRYVEIFKLWLPEFREEVERRTASSIFVPIYQSYPIRLGLDPAKGPPHGSFLDHFMRDLVPDLSWQSHDEDEFRRTVRRWFIVHKDTALPSLRTLTPDIDAWVYS